MKKFLYKMRQPNNIRVPHKMGLTQKIEEAASKDDMMLPQKMR